MSKGYNFVNWAGIVEVENISDFLFAILADLPELWKILKANHSDISGRLPKLSNIYDFDIFENFALRYELFSCLNFGLVTEF